MLKKIGRNLRLCFDKYYAGSFSCRLGVDFDKLGIGGRLWQCVDPGPPYTPGGTVFFEIMPAEEFEKEKLKENC